MQDYFMLSRANKELLENLDAETAHSFLNALLSLAFDSVDAKPEGLAGALYEAHRDASVRQFRGQKKNEPANTKTENKTQEKTQEKVHKHQDNGIYEFIVKIYKIYPKKYAFNQAMIAVKKSYDSLRDKGMSEDEAKAFIADAVQAYAKAVLTWPRADFKYILNLQTFFDDGHIYDDRSVWNRSNDIQEEDPAYITLPDGSRRRASVL